MLVLSRRIGETLKIGDDIEVQILGINHGQIRIGISAPKEVNIVRTELIGRPRKTEAPETIMPTSAVRQPTVRILRRRSY